MDQNMGLENSCPVTKGEKLNSVLKVYVRRKEGGVVNPMVQLNLGPNLLENRAEVEPRKLDLEDNYIDHMARGDLHRCKFHFVLIVGPKNWKPSQSNVWRI